MVKKHCGRKVVDGRSTKAWFSKKCLVCGKVYKQYRRGHKPVEMEVKQRRKRVPKMASEVKAPDPAPIIKKSRRGTIFWIKPEVVDCIIEGYVGVDRINGKLRRQFIWEESDGEVWIGNIAAFAEHVCKKFDREHNDYDYVNVNSILLKLGERVREEAPRLNSNTGAGSQGPLPPDKERYHAGV